MRFKTRSLNLARRLLTFERIDSFLAAQIINGGGPVIRKVVPGNNLYAPGSMRKCRRNGITFNLDVSDYQEWLIYFGIDDDSSSEIAKYLKSGDTMIDVGGNIGQTAFQAAKVVGEEEENVWS